jgi:hypothetical protein
MCKVKYLKIKNKILYIKNRVELLFFNIYFNNLVEISGIVL